MPKPLADLLLDLRAHPMDAGVMENVIDDLLDQDPPLYRADIEELNEKLEELHGENRDNPRVRLAIQEFLVDMVSELAAREGAPLRRSGGRRKSQAKRFGSCVKAVRKTVKARKGSTAEGAAIAICTTTLLHPRGRTLKRYRKGRLLTQRRR
jgi:hypothetical protein